MYTYTPKHTPPKGLEPKTMVSETPVFFVDLNMSPPQKPRIAAEYLDKDLNFRLQDFEDECSSLKFCFHNNDHSRAEVIISIFLQFFKSNMQTFSTHDVDITFFINTFTKFDTINIFRQILQLQEPPLFDPCVYFLTQFAKCDQRFCQLLADHNFLASITTILTHFEGAERRVMKNLANLLLYIIPFHRSIDPLYTDFTENFQSIISQIDKFQLLDDMKQRIVCTITNFADPIPDIYPDFIGTVINDLTHTSLKYAFLTCAQIVRKSVDFILILYELDIINKLFDFRKTTLSEVDALYPLIDFALAVLGSSELICQMKVTHDQEQEAKVKKPADNELVFPDKLSENEEEEEKPDIFATFDFDNMKFENLFSHFDFGEIRDGLHSTNSKAAIAALQFVNKTLPGTMKSLINSSGSFCNFLDAVTVSLYINNETQIVESLNCLRNLLKYEPKMTTQFLNLDFNDMIISLLKSDVEIYINGVFAFFDEMLNNKDAPIRNINNFFLSMVDSGAYTCLNKIMNDEQKPDLARRARLIKQKIADRTE